MLSSHAVKRFLMGFWWPRIYLFRHLLPRLFLWRLRIEKPKVVMLGLDTMVMDNKGFQPLQMRWGRFVMEAVFRRGDAHSNHSDTVQKMVRHVMAKIRNYHRADVPTLTCLASDLLDQELFEELKIGYIDGGKPYGDIEAYVSKVDHSSWGQYERGREQREYGKMGDRRDNWDRFRLAIFCRPQITLVMSR